MTPDQALQDAGKRLSAMYNLHLAVHGVSATGRWIGFRLFDGDTDGNLYDTKADAVRHHKDLVIPYAFVQILPSGMTPKQAVSQIKLERQMWENGIRLKDDPNAHAGAGIGRLA